MLTLTRPPLWSSKRHKIELNSGSFALDAVRLSGSIHDQDISGDFESDTLAPEAEGLGTTYATLDLRPTKNVDLFDVLHWEDLLYGSKEITDFLRVPSIQAKTQPSWRFRWAKPRQCESYR